MNRHLIGGTLALALLVLGSSNQSQEAAAQKVGKTAPGWLADYQAARTAARQTGKPIFLVFR
jgi:hypothetical protein